jgi:uncharacterized protein YidB (DUF937 family)
MGFTDMFKNVTEKNPQLKGLIGGLQSFVSQQGGLAGLKAKFESEGAGALMQSWISTGPNLPIAPEQLQKIMGQKFVQEMAAKMGIDPQMAQQKLTEMLPKLIDRLTPNGQLPASVTETSLMQAASEIITKH